jgi:hypothetical protein
MSMLLQTLQNREGAQGAQIFFGHLPGKRFGNQLPFVRWVNIGRRGWGMASPMEMTHGDVR